MAGWKKEREGEVFLPVEDGSTICDLHFEQRLQGQVKLVSVLIGK